MDAVRSLLPAGVRPLFDGVETALGLPKGLVWLLVTVVAVLGLVVVVLGRGKGVPGVAARKRDVVLILGECKSGKTVLFHQVCVQSFE